jgi:peroxiredoxin
MVELRRPSSVFALVALVLLAAGCEKSGPKVPQIDYSQSNAYGAADFKDDAPPNAKVNAADFPLVFVDSNGNPVDLAQYRGKKKVVLVVLRGVPQSPGGVFCPSCLAQTSSLLANQAQFVGRGAEVLVVFPGPSERVGEFFQRARSQTPGEPARTFQVLLDRECQACDQLGIRDDLAKPSTYILDTQGNLVYAYVGETSTDRPSVKALLAQLDMAP